jgi:sulfur-carrier protein
MRVRLFASLRELAGSPEVEIDAPDVAGLCDQLSERFGGDFARILAVGSVVVDGRTVDRGRTLAPNDEVAVLPPVSGGSAGILPSELKLLSC